MTDTQFEIIITRISKTYPHAPRDEKIPFLASLQEIKELIKIGKFQSKYHGTELTAFYNALHTQIADTYVSALKNGQIGLSPNLLKAFNEDDIKIYEYLRDYHSPDLTEAYDIFHNPIVEKIAAGFEENNQAWKPTHFDVYIIYAVEWLEERPEFKFLFPKEVPKKTDSPNITKKKNDPRFSYAKILYLTEDGVPHCEHSPAMILKDGTETWWQNGYLHRENGAAITKTDGTKIWLQQGVLHRIGGPAIELSDGRKFWYKGGKLHRADGPAVIIPNGKELWFDDGFLTRESEPTTKQEILNLLYQIDIKLGEYPFTHTHTKSFYSFGINIQLTTHFRNGLAHNECSPHLYADDGTQYWYQNAVYHREDGPAHNDPSGSKIWFQHGICCGSPNGLSSKSVIDKGDRVEITCVYTNAKGQKHRENAPAAILPKGGEIWYQNGKKHREDGPAMTSADGTQHWFINDLKHRENAPACISLAGQKEWWINGKTHRIGAPAVICANGDEYWYFEGKKHRDDGPAVTIKDHGQSWMRNGVFHREDGPAIVKSDGTKYWYIDGKIHREDGPAVTAIDGSEQWLQNGVFHRVGGPAVVNTKTIIEAWYLDGKCHREDGPAVFLITGTKEWWKNGALDRSDGPAIELSTGDGYWYKNGLKHRDGDLPAISLELGKKQCWIKEGKLHRENAPAVIFSDGHQEWWLEGKKHRESGPAIIHTDGRQEWWINGAIQKPEDIRKMIKLVAPSVSIDEEKIVFTEENKKSEGETLSSSDTPSSNVIQLPTMK